MDENPTAAAFAIDGHQSVTNSDHGWHKVTYVKRQRKPKPNDNSGKGFANGMENGKVNVFGSLEQQAEDRRRRIVDAQTQAQAAGIEVGVTRSRRWADEVEDGSESDVDVSAAAAVNGKKVEPKPKKVKKPKLTVAEAAAKIDAADLAAFLADVTGSYEGQQEIQLMRFADYFGRAFSGVTAAQFPWMKIFKESTVAKITDIPLSQIPDDVYETSVDWINQRSMDALGACVLWSLGSILAELTIHQAGAKGSKKGAQQVSSKSQVAIFVVLAMVLRRKPDVLVNLLPTLRENKYQGQDKLSVIVWMISQAFQGDLAVGLHAWAHNLLPIVGSKSCNPQSRDLILQLVERILSSPKARPILINGAVRKGERLIPPSALETMMRVTFPASSARVKATERFEAIYPTIKEVALAGSRGSKAMKQVSQQILSFAVNLAGEKIPELSKEASAVFIWCLTQNAESYKQWDNVYLDNLEASVSVLRKLNMDWNEHSVKLSPFEHLRDTLKNFLKKNEKASSDADACHRTLFKDSDRFCKAILGRISHGHICVKTFAFLLIVMGVGAAVMSPNLESWDWEKLSATFSSYFE